MNLPEKVSLRNCVVLSTGALIVLFGIFFTARIIYRKGLLVDDSRYWENIQKISERRGIDPQLVRAVIFQESRFVREAVGKKGEVGLMQVHVKGAVADWAKAHGKKVPSHSALCDVNLNLEIGTWYLSKALRRWEKYRDQIPLALVQYNAGATRAERWKPERLDGDVIPRIKIAATRAYVVNIMKRYRKYSGEKR
ncbi:MAG: transglycosylase SLT domain-containing protein [Lentisphaeria bacterium]|nr:transglycosylase SLT domain-containing protein [Lentisphaeria bacterium]